MVADVPRGKHDLAVGGADVCGDLLKETAVPAAEMQQLLEHRQQHLRELSSVLTAEHLQTEQSSVLTAEHSSLNLIE